MKILTIGLDRRVLDFSSVVAQRQAEYFKGHDVSFLLLDVPDRAKLFVFFSVIIQAFFSKGFDVVTAQDPFFCGIIGSVAAWRSGAGLHIQDHSGAFGREAFGWKEKLLRPLARFILRCADRVRTVSLRGKKGLMHIGISEDRIDVIPVATDVSYFTFHGRRETNEILCIARLEKEKGIDVLLMAFQRLKQVHPEYSLTIVGDGSLRSLFDTVIEDVRFVGNQSDVRPYLERAAVYVQPSYFEGWGMSLVEAAASGVPIVMTDVGLAGDVICDGESGLIVPRGDVERLASSIQQLLNDRIFGERLAVQARKQVDRLPTRAQCAESFRESLHKASCVYLSA